VVEDTDPKTPSVGAPQAGEGERAVVTEPVESNSPEIETPEAASTSSSVILAEKTRATGRWKALSPRARAAIAIAGGAAALIGVVATSLTVGRGAPAPLPRASAASLAASLSADTFDDAAAADTPADSVTDAAPARPAVWRVAQLADDAAVTLVDVVINRRPLLTALAEAKVPRREAKRLAQSLAEVHSVERFAPKDALAIALDAATRRVVAYEFSTSPADVWQAREQQDSSDPLRLEARKLPLEVERVRVGKAVLVGSDLRASFIEAGLAPIDDVLALLDDALEGHAELSDIRPGARLRVIATQERVNGSFVRWASLDAVEYFPATPNAPSVRVYSFGGSSEEGEQAGSASKHHGWYDPKGRQPYHGGWRSPVPLARITSRYNPHRMHPVLHVVMPHNGVDFKAPVGASVYATAAGVVESVGNDGPCGNKVEISHPGGMTSIYCHLSRFAPGLRVGQHVEQRQLIAYVGQTGRVTGPHLHFGIRRAGVFIDPMTLRLDGVRVVPRSLRDEFDRRRGVLDAELDGVPLPAAGVAAPEVAEPDNFYEEP
jgi:murein DD-endopeptidase MepM/ murein hydrolase activator NlpD